MHYTREEIAIEDYDVAIIGAGPAGLFCAIHAAAPGRRVVLFEKNPEPGRKLLLAGSGQCNITHTGDVPAFLTHYGSHGRFLKPALREFPGQALVRFFEERGLPSAAEENGKIFPRSRSSADVLRVLVNECGKKGVEIRCREPVTAVAGTGDAFAITTDQGAYTAGCLVITTGGASYPKTGSTGDGYRLAAMLGQPVTETAPALSPLIISRYPLADLSGISFADAQFSVWRDGKKTGSYQGDILLTHTGLSGPGILDASRDIRAGDTVRVSFTGTMTREAFTQEITQRIAENGGRIVKSVLTRYPMPNRLIQALLAIAQTPEDLTCAHLTAPQRQQLILLCTEFPFVVGALGDLSVAMATRGGVALDSVSQKTMESKLVPGLFFAGEVLDIDGDTGGYNLQAAFSTGHCAALGIARRAGAGS